MAPSSCLRPPSRAQKAVGGVRSYLVTLINKLIYTGLFILFYLLLVWVVMQCSLF
jgi:hypothetical protein